MSSGPRAEGVPTKNQEDDQCIVSSEKALIIYKVLNVCPIDYTAFVVSEKVGIP